MPSDKQDGLSPEARAVLARLNRPMPVQAQREYQVCVDMDAFVTAWENARSALSTALGRPGELSPYASPAAIQASWSDSLAALQAAFEKSDLAAQALIRSIKVLFALP